MDKRLTKSAQPQSGLNHSNQCFQPTNKNNVLFIFGIKFFVFLYPTEAAALNAHGGGERFFFSTPLICMIETENEQKHEQHVLCMRRACV